MNDAYNVRMFRRERLIVHQIFQRANYQGQRSSQFVRDIRIKAKSFIIQILFIRYP